MISRFFIDRPVFASVLSIVIVLAGVLLSGWHRLGDQGAQVTFTALFVLLLGGYQPLHYVTHLMIEVAIGSSPGRQNRPGRRCGTHATACGGTRGPGGTGACRGRIARLPGRWRS